MKRQGKSSSPILGIDPGSRNCGYGLVSESGQYIASGTIVVNPRGNLHLRLMELHKGLSEVINRYRPSGAVVEKIFFARSVHSALALGQARGIALLTVAEGGIDLYEYTPLEVKKAVVGYGRAEKKQVQEMVKNILGINTRLSPDGADALALAICHLNKAQYMMKVIR